MSKTMTMEALIVAAEHEAKHSPEYFLPVSLDEIRDSYDSKRTMTRSLKSQRIQKVCRLPSYPNT